MTIVFVSPCNSARILEIKDIYNFELAKHMHKIYFNIFPDYIINGFNISATAKIRETRQTSKLTYEIPLAKTLNGRRHSLFEDLQCGIIFQMILN